MVDKRHCSFMILTYWSRLVFNSILSVLVPFIVYLYNSGLPYYGISFCDNNSCSCCPILRAEQFNSNTIVDQSINLFNVITSLLFNRRIVGNMTIVRCTTTKLNIKQHQLYKFAKLGFLSLLVIIVKRIKNTEHKLLSHIPRKGLKNILFLQFYSYESTLTISLV